MAAVFAASACAASVTGSVALRDSRDPEVRKKMDYSGVVIWLEPIGAKPKLSTGVHARMIQKAKTFTPHVLAIPAGGVVDFPNFDPIFHNAFSNYDGKIFDLGLYRPGTTKSVVFPSPGIVRVFCNIHSTMSAVIAVLETPYFDVTRSSGRFEIAQVPPGEYRLRVFHERATAATLKALDRRIVVPEDGLMLPTMSISESGYLAIPHRNKYGHDYLPAPDDDDGIYPAVRK